MNLAVRTYFLVALMGRQYLTGDRDLPGKAVTVLKSNLFLCFSQNIDLFVPVMTILQFLFYMGWVKVAEVLLNPLGIVRFNYRDKTE